MDHIAFEDKTIFLTGGSGFLGTALVSKIILSTSCPSLILLSRGGLSRLHQIWQNSLPPNVFAQLHNNPRIEVFDGDICKENLGLEQATITRLQETVSIVIHAASSINLRHNLSRIAPIIVQGTLNVADFALSCKTLDRFVYISTAYANSYLSYLNPKTIPRISERIHPLGGEATSCEHTEAEWSYLQQHGTTPEYEATPFPWAYAYAKHLTERLLFNIFQESSSSRNSSSSSLNDMIDFDGKQKLLIIRPSIIGPADNFPTPGWQVAFSAPVTGFIAFLILTPAKKLNFYSQFDNPSHEAKIDEVPVDVVVNRIIAHTYMGNSGIVHANCELSGCYSFSDYFQSAQRVRRLPWNSKALWQQDRNSPKLCLVAKLYQVSGCTFDFENQKTLDLWSAMRDEEKETFPLFAVGRPGAGSKIDLLDRDEALRKLFAAYFKKRSWPVWLLPMFYNRS